MEDTNSTEFEKWKKQMAKSAFYLPFSESLLQNLVAILRFLRFKLYTQNPHDSSSSASTTAGCGGKDSYAAGSAPPPTPMDIPATSQTSRAIKPGRASRTRRRVSPPRRSRGGGGQTN